MEFTTTTEMCNHYTVPVEVKTTTEVCNPVAITPLEEAVAAADSKQNKHVEEVCNHKAVAAADNMFL